VPKLCKIIVYFKNAIILIYIIEFYLVTLRFIVIVLTKIFSKRYFCDRFHIYIA